MTKFGALGAAPRLPTWRAERVLYERDGLLIIDKPIHIPVHGGDERLRHGLVERLTDWRAAAGQPTYLGVHSRLDQATSGALLLTTDEARNREVAQAFEQRALLRRYLAVVSWDARTRLRAQGTLQVRLEQQKGRVQVVRSGGQLAVTQYRVLRRQGQLAWVELELETGRLHQIRASLAEFGAPIVGDRWYGGAPAARLFLHATELAGDLLPEPIRSAPPAEFELLLGGALSAAQLAEKLWDAALLRAPLVERTQAFRLFNGEGDGVPGLVIDVYGPFACINLYDRELEPQLETICEVLRALGYESAYLKLRVRADLRQEKVEELAQLHPLYGPEAPPEFVVEECGLRVAISLADGLSTGLFVDQRENRERLRAHMSGGRMLNLFCYTASFSVAAALAGAQTVSVDLSGRALARARQNFAHNGLDVTSHAFFKEDAMKYLARAVRRGEQFDFIVLDPPSFATVGKGTFQVKGRYQEAARLCFQLLKPEGRLLAVTNHQKTSLAVFRRMLLQAAQEAQRQVTAHYELGSGIDCPDAAGGPWPSKSLLVAVL